MENALGIGDANSEGAHADTTKRAVAGDDNRRRWVELHGVLPPRLNVVDEVAVDEM